MRVRRPGVPRWRSRIRNGDVIPVTVTGARPDGRRVARKVNMVIADPDAKLPPGMIRDPFNGGLIWVGPDGKR